MNEVEYHFNNNLKVIIRQDDGISYHSFLRSKKVTYWPNTINVCGGSVGGIISELTNILQFFPPNGKLYLLFGKAKTNYPDALIKNIRHDLDEEKELTFFLMRPAFLWESEEGEMYTLGSDCKSIVLCKSDSWQTSLENE